MNFVAARLNVLALDVHARKTIENVSANAIEISVAVMYRQQIQKFKIELYLESFP